MDLQKIIKKYKSKGYKIYAVAFSSILKIKSKKHGIIRFKSALFCSKEPVPPDCLRKKDLYKLKLLHLDKKTMTPLIQINLKEAPETFVVSEDKRSEKTICRVCNEKQGDFRKTGQEGTTVSVIPVCNECYNNKEKYSDYLEKIRKKKVKIDWIE